MELKKYKLEEIADIIGGVAYRPSDICDYGIRILRGGNINSRNIMLKDDDVFLPLSYTDQENQVHFGDTILVASTGSVDVLGKAATCFEEIPFTQIGAFLRIIRPKEQCYTMLISIAVNSEYFAKYIKSQARGTSINNITINYLKEFKIYCPTNYLPICNLYSILENKILLNRKINQNLEAMAKQLYDYWFVQFDFPDENGRPYKSSGGKMVWNEKLKREIPQGWDVKTMGNCTTILLGGTPDTNDNSLWGDGYNWLNSGEVAEFPILSSEKYITQKGLEKSSTVLAPKGSVTLSITRHLRPSILCIDACINQSVVAILENEILTNEYIYPLVNREIPRLMSLRTGAQQPHINKEIVESINVVIPPQGILYAYIKKSKSLYKSIFINAQEIADLAKQRDELLPLLMNGRVLVG